ncbi:RidA family protein [Pseudomonas guariconensis]
MFLSGEVPFDSEGKIPAGVGAQTELTLSNISATLAREGLSLADVISVTVYLTNRDDFAEFNRVYASHFSAPLPVRTTICTQLMIDACVELTVIAARHS